MRLPLRRHPDSPCLGPEHIEVELAARGDGLALSYVVTGKISDLSIPPVTTAVRSDELWRHTCFEAFACAPPDTRYYEFNFSPSTQWAAYSFGSYRTGMCVATEVGPPAITMRSSPDSFTLRATLDLEHLSGLPRQSIWHLGLSAIVENVSGQKSYWALAHPPGKPDFHHPTCFAGEFFPLRQP
jgi:hypothetical protein